MAGISDDYRTLTEAILQGSRDYGNLALGVSKFLSEKRVTDEDVRKKNLENNAIAARETFLDSPANITSIAQTLGFKGTLSELMDSAEQDMPAVLSAFNLKIDPTKRAFVNEKGEVVTNRFFQHNGPAIQGLIMANTDPGSRIQRVISRNKFILEENPNDATAQKNLADAEAAYENYRKNPQPYLERELGNLYKAQGLLKSVGADTGLVDKRLAFVDSEMGKISQNARDRANWIKLSDRAAKLLGIDMSEVPKEVADNIVTAMGNYQVTMGKAAMDVKAGNLQALLKGPQEAYKLAVEQDKNLQDITGKRWIVDPKTKQRREMTQGERQLDITRMAGVVWNDTIEKLEKAGIPKALMGNRYPEGGLLKNKGVGGLGADAQELDSKVNTIRTQSQNMPADVKATVNKLLNEAAQAASGPKGSLFNAGRILDKALAEIERFKATPDKQANVNASITKNVKNAEPKKEAKVDLSGEPGEIAGRMQRGEFGILDLPGYLAEQAQRARLR